MIGTSPATIDTNIAIYALTSQDRATSALATLASSSFLSVQVLNEYANVAVRKFGRTWQQITDDVETLRTSVPHILPIRLETNADAIRLSERYRLPFYDALMLAVALTGGARTIYSEDMQHGLLIEGSLRIIDPFRE